MKKSIAITALVITASFSFVGFQSYSKRDERAQVASIQERLHAVEVSLEERDAAINTLHIALTQLGQTRDAGSQRAYGALQAEWHSLDRKYTADVRAYNMLADSLRVATAKVRS